MAVDNEPNAPAVNYVNMPVPDDLAEWATMPQFEFLTTAQHDVAPQYHPIFPGAHGRPAGSVHKNLDGKQKSQIEIITNTLLAG